MSFLSALFTACSHRHHQRPAASARGMVVVRRTPPWVVAAAFALLWLAVAPRTPDLAAQVYRVSLWAREGFAVWDGSWFAGHHLPAYSLLYPPLGALLGARVVGVATAIGSTLLFDRLARGHFGPRARAGSVWFAVASVADLWIGRLTFSLGICIGLAALLAWQRGRPGVALALAAVCGAASPVAGAFLGLAAAAVAVTAVERQRRTALALGAVALGVVATLSFAFPEGGSQPFKLGSLLAVVGFTLAFVVFTPARERTLRAGAALYLLAALAMFVAHTPMGSNTARLGATFAGPLLACMLAGVALPRSRRRLLVAVAIGTAIWQWYAPAREVAISVGDRSMQAAYYSDLVTKLHALQDASGPGRVEVPFTRGHWESVLLADRVPLARGWETQLDRKYDALFFGRRLRAASYERWLRRTGVHWVAVSDAPTDPAGKAEARLVNRGLPYLQLVWADAHWRLYALEHPLTLITGPATLTALRRDGFSLHAQRAGSALVRVHFTSYFQVSGAAACVASAPGGWTRVRMLAPGTVSVRARFSAQRVLQRGQRCGDGGVAGST
jgi:hypothetical protein